MKLTLKYNVKYISNQQQGHYREYFGLLFVTKFKKNWASNLILWVLNKGIVLEVKK